MIGLYKFEYLFMDGGVFKYKVWIFLVFFKIFLLCLNIKVNFVNVRFFFYV